MSNGLDYNEILDQYTKTYAKEGLRRWKIFYKLFKKRSDKFLHKTLPEEKTHLKKLLHASKAIHLGADPQIPMETLALLGETALDAYYSVLIRNVIKNNMLEYNGMCFKLNDLENQIKIQRAIRTRKFNMIKDQVA